MPRFLAFGVQFHISNFECAVNDKSHLEGQLVNTNPSVVRVVFTEPIMYLLQPCLTRTFYWRVEEDDLILYPDFVYNRLQSHAPFQELSFYERQCLRRSKCVTNLLSALLVTTTLTRNGVTP